MPTAIPATILTTVSTTMPATVSTGMPPRDQRSTPSAGAVRTLRKIRHPSLDVLIPGEVQRTFPITAAERSGINLWSEYSLHAQLKIWVATRDGAAHSDAAVLSRVDEHSSVVDSPSVAENRRDTTLLANPRLEVSVLGRIVDLILPDGELIEIQSSNFGSILEKVQSFSAAGFRVRLIYPVITRSVVVRLDPVTGEVVSRRKSPKKRDFWSVFDQMVHAPGLAALPGVLIEVLCVEVEDVRMRDGLGSWRRKGDSLLDRNLTAVGASRVFGSRADWLALLPESESVWTAGSLSLGLGIPAGTARKVLYTYAKAGFLVESGRKNRCKLYQLHRRLLMG